MARIPLKPILDRFVAQIATRNMYSGNRIPDSIMRLIQVEERANGGGVLAPYWLSVLEHGRGARKSTKDSGLWKRIYAWMDRRGMFRSSTEAGKVNEAKGLTWYINKYGNKQFRNRAFVDIYTQARQQTIAELDKEYSLAIGKITQDII